MKINSKPWSGVPKKVSISIACPILKQAIQQHNYVLGNTIASAILKKTQNHPLVYYYLALGDFAQGKTSSAESFFRKAFEHGLNQPSGFLNFASLKMHTGDYTQALYFIEQALEVQPIFEEALHMACKISAILQRHDLTIKYAKMLTEQLPKSIDNLSILATAYHQNIQDEKALDVITQGLTHSPSHLGLLYTKATIFELQNKLLEAQHIINDILNVEPDNISAQIVNAKLLNRQNKADEAKPLLTQMLGYPNLAPEYKQAIYSELVTSSRQLQSHQETWQCAEMMNTLSTKLRPNSGTLKQIEKYFDDLEKSDLFITPEISLANGIDKKHWLFIVGFPRVGSTLLEKSLYEMFDCASASESSAMTSIEQNIYESTGKSWWTLKQSELQNLNTEALIESAQHTYQAQNIDNASALVDKNLLNLSRLLMINQLLPTSPIIRMIRHPLDIVVSCYINNFASNEAWHTDLEIITRYLLRVETHWFSVADKMNNPVHVLRYEDMVQQKKMPDDLNAFLQEHWSAPCRTSSDLKFQTRTASYAQVAKPINSLGLYQYRNYLNLIPPNIIDILTPLVERWGYRV